MRLTRAEVDAAITLSGIEAYHVEEIQNGYDRDSPAPWFAIHTPDGNLRFGPRGSVIELDWSLTNRRRRLAPVDGIFAKSTSTQVSIQLDNKFELAQYLEKWRDAEPAEEFMKLVATGDGVGQYLLEFATDKLAADPIFEYLTTHAVKLYKVTDPVTAAVSFHVVSAIDNYFVLPAVNFKR